jgi:signal transduction histidine kinase
VERLHALGAALLLPLVSNRSAYLIGLVALGAKETDEWHTRQEMAALRALSRTAATAAQNVLLFETLQQQLVELQAERAFREAAWRRALEAAETERQRLSQALHDSLLQELDHMKRALTTVRAILQSLLSDYEEHRPTLECQAGPQDESPHASIASLLIKWHRQLGLLSGEALYPVPPFASLLSDRSAGRRSLNTTQPAGEADDRLSQLASLLSDESLGRPPLIATQPTIEALLTHLDTTIAQAKSICSALHPRDLQDPFTTILLRTVTAFSRQYPQVQIAFLTSGQDEPQLSGEVKISGRTIVELAIHNALQHAQPAQVAVHLLYHSDGGAVLTITDDGCGFTPLHPREYRTADHHGLPNMHEHAASIGGELQIESEPGRGTRVTLRIPAPVSHPET